MILWQRSDSKEPDFGAVCGWCVRLAILGVVWWGVIWWCFGGGR